MKSIVRVKGKGKSRVEPVDVLDQEGYDGLEVDVRLALIQALLPLGLMKVGEELEEEVRSLAGDKHKRNGHTGYDRWGRQAGSVYVGKQRCRLYVPRVRDTVKGREVPLQRYQKLQQPGEVDEVLFRRVLHGLSCRNYGECAEAVPGVFGLSSSTVSRRFIRVSKRKL